MTLADDLVESLDERVGERGRSAFIAGAVAQALDDEHRWDLIESSIATIRGSGHAWDDDPASWVHAERRTDSRRVG